MTTVKFFTTESVVEKVFCKLRAPAEEKQSCPPAMLSVAARLLTEPNHFRMFHSHWGEEGGSGETNRTSFELLKRV